MASGPKSISPVPREVGTEYGSRCAHGPMIRRWPRRAFSLRASRRICVYIASVSNWNASYQEPTCITGAVTFLHNGRKSVSAQYVPSFQLFQYVG